MSTRSLAQSLYCEASLCRCRGALFDSMTGHENLDFLLARHTRLKRPERRDKIAEILDWVSLADKAPQYPAELSGGQKKRIAQARAISG